MRTLTVFLLLFLPLYALEPLKVGMELGFPPFETIDEQGKPTGYSVELAYALGKALNREIIIENIPFIGLIAALKAKKIDLIISSLSITEERKKSIALSNPYLKMGLAMLISEKSNLQGIEEADTSERIIAVRKGSIGEEWAKDHLTHCSLLVLNKDSACALEVIQGKADAFLYDQLTIYKLWKKNEKTTRANLSSFIVGGWGIGVRQEETQFLNEVNLFLDKWLQSPEYENMRATYLKEYIEAFERLGIPFYN